jgi:hypothetical protein
VSRAPSQRAILRLYEWGVVLIAFLSLFGATAMAIESPDYRVLDSEGAFELREYPSYLIAETEVESGFMNAGNVAFGRLFRYISGANVSQARIAMTAPVEQASVAGERIAMTAPVEQVSVGTAYRVGFIVPRQYNLDTVPQPTDSRVKIRQVPPRRVAVWRYSGRWTEENFREHEQLLRGALRDRGIAVDNDMPAIIARYDAPFMPWFMRRNEVHISLNEVSP